MPNFPRTASTIWFPQDTAEWKPWRPHSDLGSQMQVNGTSCHPVHPPGFEAASVFVEEAMTFPEALHWGRIWLVLRPRGPDVIMRARPKAPSSQNSSSLLAHLAHFRMGCRQAWAKARGFLASVSFPCLMRLQF